MGFHSSFVYKYENNNSFKLLVFNYLIRLIIISYSLSLFSIHVICSEFRL
ncbi:hypothetical protein CNEO2_50059 [Clostridium neonatale]|nr:hypothetical protein CNEO2_60059 [Clostridium neonatale]CAI3241316.1 hypothetical protein CNEO2_30059 [Clostridium neonatale]CAI3603976.1 hypothetical protein CNEO3_210060 [Clostridium neonatale]CAI3621560.1 hypothetical protein CNEO3_320039 [Clostridium neonatale]CAI3656292.1 hypothetical protein CNEO2_50059 [Clostridium neonatale]